VNSFSRKCQNAKSSVSLIGCWHPRVRMAMDDKKPVGHGFEYESVPIDLDTGST
jgi:hypothetical protein